MKSLNRLINYVFASSFVFIVMTVYAKDIYYNPSDAEGYVSVEKNGIVKYFIVVSSGNGIQLIPVKENPEHMLKSVDKVISNINTKLQKGGISDEK